MSSKYRLNRYFFNYFEIYCSQLYLFKYTSSALLKLEYKQKDYPYQGEGPIKSNLFLTILPEQRFL